jgi:hypothetical protein
MKGIQNKLWEHPTYHHVRYPITFCSAFLPALIFIQRSTTNQIQLLFADQSALTAAATSLGSAHQDLYKRHSSQPAMISELQSVISDIQPATASASQSACLVQSDRSSESLALHCARDGCLGPTVVMPNSPGNWPPRLAGSHTRLTG